MTEQTTPIHPPNPRASLRRRPGRGGSVVEIVCGFAGLGDQVCAISAAREYARKHRDLNVLYASGLPPEVVNAYGDRLVAHGTSENFVYAEPPWSLTWERWSSDGSMNYVGLFYRALGLKVAFPPRVELPSLPPPEGLPSKSYVVLQPYSVCSLPNLSKESLQILIDIASERYPVVAAGAGPSAVFLDPVATKKRTPLDLERLDYSHLGGVEQFLRVVQHAAAILTPRSGAAHVAAGYGVPALVWTPTVGEGRHIQYGFDWHLDYPGWDRIIVPMYEHLRLFESVGDLFGGPPMKTLAFLAMAAMATTASAAPSMLEHPTPPKPKGRVINLMPAINLKKDCLIGEYEWSKDGKSLTATKNGTSASATRIELPYQPPLEYDFSVTYFFPAGSRPGSVALILSGGPKKFASWWYELGGYNGRFCGFDRVGGQACNANKTSVERDFKTEVEYMVTVEVRKDKIAAILNGERLCEYETDFTDLSNPGFYNLTKPGTIGVGTAQTPSEVRAITVTEISGPGKFTRAVGGAR
jgi:hypothetical protein